MPKSRGTVADKGRRQRVAKGNQKLLTQLLDLVNCAGFISQNGVIVYANRACARLLEARYAHRLIGTAVLSILGAKSLKSLMRSKATRTGVPMVAMDGTQRLVSIRRVPCEWMGRAAHSFLFNSVADSECGETSPNLCISHPDLRGDPRFAICYYSISGELMAVNPCAVKLLGYSSEEELLSHNLCEIYESREVFEAGFCQDLGRSELLEATVDWRQKDGTLIPVSVRRRPVLDCKGEVSYFELIAQRLVENPRTAAHLQHSGTMERLSIFSKCLAHDFNNILMIISNHAELMLNVTPQDSQRRNTEQILVAASRGAEVAKRLLAFSSNQLLNPTLMDPNKLVANAASMAFGLLSKDIQVVIIEGSELRKIWVDEEQMMQVLLSICGNSHDAMSGKGVLTIETSNIALDGMAAGELGLQPGQYVRISLTDTGAGIDPSVLPYIFEPFFTTKQKTIGTGLGLSVAYGVVKQSGGMVAVKSERGQGTTVELVLPAAEGQVVINPA